MIRRKPSLVMRSGSVWMFRTIFYIIGPTNASISDTLVKNGGGGVMILGCFSANPKPNMDMIEGTLDSVAQWNILTKIFLPFSEDKHFGGWIFQQNSASTHTSNHKKMFYDV